MFFGLFRNHSPGGKLEFLTRCSWSPFGVYSELENESTRRLVAIPLRSYNKGKRFFPDFDREDKKYVPKFKQYQLFVETRFFTMRHYQMTADDLSHHWLSDKPGRKLKKVVLSEGLISTALNRKTMIGARINPAENLSTMLRLLSANPHYAENPNYIRKGRSIYRDMALVCGAVVTRDVYHDNQHF